MMWMRRSKCSSTILQAQAPVVVRPLRKHAVAISITLVFAMFVAGHAAASDNLQLLPDYGLFNLFGESYFGDLWIMIIGFVLLIFPLNQLIFKPIFQSLDRRAERINGARARSVDLQKQADAVLDRYETSIREARGESEQARQAGLLRAREEQATLTAEARGEAERELVSARAELGRSLEDARASLRSTAEELAGAAAEQVLGRALS
jgi:F-type H+-transporting ATPase subunit b